MELVIVMFVVMLVLALAFGAMMIWVIILIARAFSGGAKMVYGAGARSLGLATGKLVHLRKCERTACGALNPHDARFCRRCGKELDQSLKPMKVRLSTDVKPRQQTAMPAGGDLHTGHHLGLLRRSAMRRRAIRRGGMGAW